MTSTTSTISSRVTLAVHSPRRLQHRRPVVSRLLSATSSNATSPDTFPSTRHETLTLLHKAISLAPTVLGQTTHSATSKITESPEFWSRNLARVYEDLNAVKERPARVVVYGVDEWSGARELVTALMEEPLSSDDSLSTSLRDRWKDSEAKITLSLSASTSPASHISLPSSSYLSQFPIPVEITEMSPPSDTHSPFSRLDEAAVAELFQADVPVVVCNHLSTPLSVLQNAHLPSNTILVITSAPSALTSDFAHKLAQAKNGSPSVLSSKWKVVFADPARAIGAIEVFKANPNSPSAIQRYQDGFAGSGVSSVTSALRTSLQVVDSATSSTSHAVAALRTNTALSSLEDVLLTSKTSLHRAKAETSALRCKVSQLNDRIEELKITAETDVLGIKERSSSGDSVKEALEKARKDMKVLMDHLTWWKMLWRVDEIGTVVSSEVQRVWCPELEKKLILQAGKLSVTQEEFAKTSFSLLSSIPPPYNSALLRNKLLQLQSSPSYPLTPQTLTHPLYSRKSQIIEYPTTRLHLAGQRIVMTMSAGVAANVGVGWSGWLGWFTGTGEGLLGIVGMEPATAVGMGMLGTVVSMRWAVGRWEKAKRKWWADWARVEEGLDRDLRTTVHQAVSDKVVVVADSACKGLSKLTGARKEELASIEEKLNKMSVELETVKERRGPNKA